jgi:hypothetical protein
VTQQSPETPDDFDARRTVKTGKSWNISKRNIGKSYKHWETMVTKPQKKMVVPV